MPWAWLLLGILEEHGKTATLHDIYVSIEEQFDEIQRNGEEIIASRLFDPDPRYGNRPKYQHTVRGLLSAYKKNGLVEHIDKATYRLTDAGLRRLEALRRYV